jgi:hypothetical protein
VRFSSIGGRDQALLVAVLHMRYTYQFGAIVIISKCCCGDQKKGCSVKNNIGLHVVAMAEKTLISLDENTFD